MISTHTSRVGCDNCQMVNTEFTLNFYSHIPCGMWQTVPWIRLWFGRFLLTHPVWDVTEFLIIHCYLQWISTHTSRVGCDIAMCEIYEMMGYFYSHIPCGMWRKSFTSGWRSVDFYSHIPCGMWLHFADFWADYSHFYSHIPCGMWLLFFFLFCDSSHISTHTSRVGCDWHLMMVF